MARQQSIPGTAEARIDELDECRRWLDEETCQERTRPHRHCGARADVVIDGEEIVLTIGPDHYCDDCAVEAVIHYRETGSRP